MRERQTDASQIETKTLSERRVQDKEKIGGVGVRLGHKLPFKDTRVYISSEYANS